MCFSPRKCKIFADYSGKKSPIKVKKNKEIKLTEDFTEVLAVSLTQDTKQFVSTTIEGEILEITTINS